MAAPLTVFCRTEKKYLLTAEQYRAFSDAVSGYLTPDEYGKSTVLSHYLDTRDHRLIRASLDAENYKEKLRVRSYGVPDSRDGTVFFEIKKKCDGIVYKRRVPMTYAEAETFLTTSVPPRDSQIARELAYSLRFYGFPMPSVLIACEREAFFCGDGLRLTFDSDVRYSFGVPLLSSDGGKPLFRDGEVLLEVKCGGGMPLWLTGTLDRLGLFPASFSKCGAAYLEMNEITEHRMGEIYYG